MSIKIAPSNQIFNANRAIAEAPWWQGTVIYELYLRSFQDSNGDGVGDLKGILQRLPYLHELGIGAIWITPFFRSPMADFGYDVSDYCDIDPIFGTLDDFDALVEAAHALDIRVIIDFVPNHSSDQHPWFIESRSSHDNPKRDWYIWRDPQPDGQAPNNWEGFFGGSAWTLDENTGQYYLHLFLEQQPDLNWRSPELVETMQNVLHFWLQKGVDGFRLDAITTLIKNDAFPDMPSDDPRFQGALLFRLVDVHNHPELHPILKNFRSIVDSYAGNPVLIGETNAANFYELMGFYGEQLDSLHLPMNLRTTQFAWDAQAIRLSIIEYYTVVEGAIPSIVFGNHDIGRCATRLGEANHRSVNMLLLTLWGVPTLYYGDELGMTDAHILPEQRQDPYVSAGSGRDPERTPMQWDSSPTSGFTDVGVKPWLPVNTTFQSNVAEQRDDPTSTLNFCKRLLHHRQQSPALKFGSIQFMETGESDVLVYQREATDERLLVLINFGASSHVIDLSSLAHDAELILSSKMDAPRIHDVSRFVLHPHESLVLQVH